MSLAFKKPTYGELIDLFEQSDNAEQLLSNFLISFPDMKSQIGRTDRFWDTVKRLAAPSQPSLTGKIALEGTQLSHYRSKTWEPRIRNKTGLWWLYNVSLVYFPYVGSDITFPLELNEYGLDEELLTAVFDQILSGTEPLLWYLKGVPCVAFYQKLHTFLKKWSVTSKLTKATIGKFSMLIDKNLSSKGWRVDYVYRFINKLCKRGKPDELMSYGMDRQVIETRAAQRDLEECTDHAENLTLKVSDLKKQLAVSKKKLHSAQLCLKELTQRTEVLRKERDIA